MLTLLLIGLAAGVLSGIFGIGGGVVIVPALMYFAAFPPVKATGTSLAALLLPVGLLGALTYWRAGQVDVRAALAVAGGLFLGAYGGARIALAVPGPWLKRAFAVFLVAIAVKLWMDAAPAPSRDEATAASRDEASATHRPS